MRYTVSALLVVLAMLLCAGAYAQGNVVYQENLQSATVDTLTPGGTYGSLVNQKEANMGIVIGEANNLNQFNTQTSTNFLDIDDSLKASNNALVIGTDNMVDQTNIDPGSVNITQLNELIVMGTNNSVDQTNEAVSTWSPEGDENYSLVNQDQSNFGVVFGMGNSVTQSNFANATSVDGGIVNQTQMNAAYIYGTNNTLSQYNTQDGLASGEELDTQDRYTAADQTQKNLAFIISTNSSVTTFVPPVVNMTLTPALPLFPPIPISPAPFNMTFPMDP